MGVLKNDVGRPSNKTIKIRRILKISAIVLVLILCIGCVYYFSLDKNIKDADEDPEIEMLSSEQITIYKKGDSYYSSIISDASEYKEVNTYYCEKDGCKVVKQDDYDQGIYDKAGLVVIYDGNYVIYDFINDVSTEVKLSGIKKSDIKNLQLITNDIDVLGYILTDNNDKTAIYNIKLNKLITDYKYDKHYSNNNYIDYNKGYVSEYYTNGDKSYSVLIDFNTGKEVITEESGDAYISIEEIGKNKYIVFSYGPDPGLYNIYNLSFKNIVKETSYYGYDENGNIAYESNNKFYVVDKNGNNIYTSKTYKEESVKPVNDYVIVIDDDNYLKLLSYTGKEIHKFVKFTNDMTFHIMLSGWYKENGKNGIYVVVQDKNVKYDDLSDKLKSELSGGADASNDYGYEYYYIPSTKETGKIATYIGGYAKPVLYLYPTKNNTKVSVSFEKPELLTTTYPKYKNSWNVTANKNGDLKDKNGKYYYGLYWEESGSTNVKFDEGFYVTKDNAIEFLEEKLSTIGFTDRERNEFIMYWLPILEKNEKNLVYFELTKSRENYNKLIISPKPDSLLRVAIHVKKVNKKVNIKEQKLTTFERKGFTVVEWGGVIH